ncbi:MAG: CDP-alcohol phosphatidyltransferase family protein [Dehalococcoidales bacterium]|nr:CDP-alcohol phosphatidyltransferase family protein [Dehalococcoidales bacterium]
MTTIRLSQVRKAISHYLTSPVVQLLARTPVTPSTLTFLGFVVTVGAAVLIATGYLLIAGLVVLVAGLFDMLDGALARRTNRVTRFGAVLDSTIDRLSEGALLLGILLLFAREGSTIGILLAGGVLTTSMLVSYIRARAEALGIECTVGLFTRPERVIVLVLGLMLNQIEIALAIMITFSLFTIVQRLTLVWRYTRNG